ncbi:DUF423 domain-containing protein [Urechidicola sp. KH5]
MQKILIAVAILGAITIVLGAFGAHALKEQLSITQIQSFETAVKYQMYHVLVLLFVNIYQKFPNKTKKNLSLLFFIGILFFSGSIYAITIFNIPASKIWYTTPIGGTILILGWLKLSISFFRAK